MSLLARCLVKPNDREGMTMTATASLTREAIDQIIEDHFRREADGDVEGTLATFTDDVVHDVVDDMIWTARVVGEFMGIPGHGRRISIRILHVFEFRGGLISRENVWIDAGAAIAQLTSQAGAEPTGR